MGRSVHHKNIVNGLSPAAPTRVSPRKRKREAEEEEEGERIDIEREGEEGGEGGLNHDAASEEEEELSEDARLEKEREAWEAFREEHYEVLEQLPLTLRRQLSLMKELDGQASGYMQSILPTLHQYIDKRRMYATQPDISQQNSHSASPPPPSSAATTSTFAPPPPSTPLRTPATAAATFTFSSYTPNTPHPSTPSISIQNLPPERAKTPKTTQGLLSQIAWLTEELVRASGEKVNLARAATDSVDRHIRLLDQSIFEQETSLSLALAEPETLNPDGTPNRRAVDQRAMLFARNDAELVVPKWSRPTRAATSPMPDELDGLDDALSAVVLGIQGDNATGYDDGASGMGENGTSVPPSGVTTAATRGRKGKRGKYKRNVHASDQAMSAGLTQIQPGHTALEGGMESLKITLPASQQQNPQSSVDGIGVNGGVGVGGGTDPAEELYCYCNRISFGSMIACDNKGCEREWFHLECTDLTETPKGRWYCQNCVAAGKKRGRR